MLPAFATELPPNLITCIFFLSFFYRPEEEYIDVVRQGIAFRIAGH
jgi:hypothetical protein